MEPDLQTTDYWKGMVFKDTADNSISELEHCLFYRPEYAVTVDSLSSTIFECEFVGSERGDVFVPNDTRISHAAKWSLLAPTRVVVSDSDPEEASPGNEPSPFEDPERVEIRVYGQLKTCRPAGRAATDSVVFTSTSSTPTDADWGGLFFEYHPWGECSDFRVTGR
jgi:hypothetical protein